MNRSECPNRSELIGFHLGNVPEDRQNAIAEHLETCPACEGQLGELDGMVDDVVVAVRQAAPWEDAPATAPPPRRVSTPAPAAGMRVGDYEVIEEIGRGGMGLVYKARHVRLHRVVALKILLSGELASPEYRARFLAEAEAVARLRHPHIVQIYEIGQWQPAGGTAMPFLALEYIDGGSLSEHIRDRPQPPRLAADWVETLARAVQHAHEKGVIHRDLKPANVLFTRDGQVKLCDFGVAKVFAGPDLRTHTGLLIGTPEYMAPEQAAGLSHHIAPAADVWGLGAILYTLLGGRPPFTAPDHLAVLLMVQQDDPVPPRQLQPAVPRDLETLCLKCLHKDPRKRYSSAAELADDLARFRQGHPVCARPTGAAEKTWKWACRRPGAATVLLTVLLLVTAGLPGVTYLWLRTERARQLASESLDEAEAALYYNRVALARQGLEMDGVGQARLMLDRCLPAPGRADLRGWEWQYLHAQAHPGLVPGMQHAISGWCQEVAWSPDGRRLASAAGLSQYAPPSRSTPGEVKVWDAATGRCEATLAAHTGAVLTVAWHPGGRTLVSGGADGRVYQWDLSSPNQVPRLLQPPSAPNDIVTRLRYSPDGKYLAIGKPLSLTLWDLEAGRPRHTDLSGLRGVAALAFRPTGRPREKGGTQLLAGLNGERETPIWLWEIAGSGKPTERRLRIPAQPCNCIAFGQGTSSGLLALTRMGTSEVEIWDAEGTTRRERLRGHKGEVLSLSFAPNGALATAGEDGTVRLWDPASGQERVVYRGHVGGVMSVAFGPDGSSLVSAGKDMTVRLWDASRDPQGLNFRVTTNGFGEYLGGLAFDEDGKSLVVVSQNDKQVRRFDAATGRRIEARAVLIAPTPTNPRLDQALRPDGKRLAAPVPAEPRVLKVWNVDDGTEVATLTGHEGPVLAVAWSADGDRLATSTALGDRRGVVVRTWDARTGRELRRWHLEDGTVRALALSREGDLLGAAFVQETGDGIDLAAPAVVRVWNTRTGRQEHRLEGARGAITAMAFRPDGLQLAAAGYHASRVYAWELGGRNTFLERSSLSIPTSVAYSPDGTRLVAGCHDNRVRMWDSRSLHEAITLPSLGLPGSGNYNYTSWVAFSPDGRRLAAVNWRGEVSVWHAPLPEALPVR